MEEGNKPKDAANELRNERVHVLLTTSELEALDAWRRANGISNRNEAVRFLLKRGMR